jgi:hypothetical protein
LVENAHNTKALVDAIHGAVASWGGVEPRKDFRPLDHLVPETVFARKNFTRYLEAYAEPSDNGSQSKLRGTSAQEKFKKITEGKRLDPRY